jgi:crotonobetainyl-CoA:carnitine CoA-transferase CaiB-like acyl-CoA transferase
MEVGVSYGDPNGGIHGAVAILAALWHRQRTGEGQYIDQSQWESAIAVLPEGVMAQVMNGEQPQRRGNRDGVMAPHGTFRSAGEDEWVSIACGSDDEFRALCRVVEQPGLADDPRFATMAARKQHEDELEALITEWTRARDRWQATRALQEAGVAAFPSMTSADLVADPHLRERGILVELEHLEVGTRTHIGIPWQMSATPCAVQAPAPLLGQHTDEVLREVLHMSDPEIADLRDKGVFV